MLALVTCAAGRDVDTDLPLLARELPDAAVVEWDDPEVDWSEFGAVIIRSTWDYHQRRDEFLDWAREVAATTALWNPYELVAWNTDKRYLLELDRAGIPTIPTTLLPPGDLGPCEGVDPAADVVVKPTVGAGSNGVVRTRADAATLERHVARLHADGHVVMVQPYIAAIAARGETGLVYLDGSFSHAFGKAAILESPAELGNKPFADERVEPRTATPEQLAVGQRVMDFLPDTAYARIDLVPGEDGPLVLEVEVTEPSLFLETDPGSPARAAAAFRSLDA